MGIIQSRRGTLMWAHSRHEAEDIPDRVVEGVSKGRNHRGCPSGALMLTSCEERPGPSRTHGSLMGALRTSDRKAAASGMPKSR